MSLEAQGEIRERLMQLVVTTIGRIVVAKNADRLFEKLFQEELALDRSIGFTGSFVTLGNILGYTSKTRLSSWADPQARAYSLERSKAWDANDTRIEKQPDSSTGCSTFTFGKGDPPPELLDDDRIKHSQIQTVSLIRVALWHEANWCGTAFPYFPDKSSPPVLAPMFEDMKAAKQILAHWRNELGIRDAREQLRIAIVRGINKANPYSYRVAIGSNPEVISSQADIRHVILVNRVNTMAPASGPNLERFLRNYKAFGWYYLIPAITRGELSAPEIIWDHYLIKRDLHVRQAWEIGRHDVDCAAILEDDAPIIPAGQENPPVLELLRWKREQLSSST